MKTLSSVILLFLAVVPFAFAEPSQLGGTWFFSVPTKEVEQIRALRNEPFMGTDVGLVGGVLQKREGVEIICDWWAWPAWDDQEKSENKDKRIRKEGGGPKTPFALLTWQHKAEDGVGLQSLGMNCVTVFGRRGLEDRRFICETGPLPVIEGQWREIAAWENGDTTWLVWQRFPPVERRKEPAPDGGEWYIPPPPGAPEDAVARKAAHLKADAERSFKVELLFFRTTPESVAQLAKAGPENREKAAKWLMARGLPWRKVRICQSLGPEKRKWYMDYTNRDTSTSDETKPKKAKVVEKSSSLGYRSALNLDVSGNRTGDVLSMEIGVSHTEGDIMSKFVRGSVSLEKITPAWDFILPKDCGELNVVVYRELKE